MVGDQRRGGGEVVFPHSAKIPALVGVLLASVLFALGFSVCAVRCYRKKRRPRLYSNSTSQEKLKLSLGDAPSSVDSSSWPPSSRSSQSLQPFHASHDPKETGAEGLREQAYYYEQSRDLVSPYLGSLYFSCEYDNAQNALLVTVLRVADLPATAAGSADPYIKLQLLPEKKHRVKTRVLRKTRNPVYDETFTFYGVEAAELQTLSLHFVALSFDRYSRDEVLGEVLYPLQDKDLSRELSVCEEINSRQLKLSLQGRGEALVSLCYQPAASRLTVVVLKASNLPKLDLSGLGDPFVKVYLLFEGKPVAKKKTHVRKRTLNPVFNESFAFDIPGEDLSSFGIELEVLNWDRMTRNEVIGRAEISARAEAGGRQHWFQVMSSPRKQIAQWHKLEQ